jgi:hypothetical protein
MQPCLLQCDTLKFLECKDATDLPCIYCWVKICIHEEACHRSRYVCVCVSIFLNTTALTLESSIFSHFLEQDIQLFCGELCSTHPRTRVHYYSLTYFLEKWALLTLGHLFINLLFFMPFFFLRGGGGSSDP